MVKKTRNLLAWLFLLQASYLWAQEWQFVEVTSEAGLNFNPSETLNWASVVAVDYNQDGWVDLMITKDGGGPNLLYRNKGDGTFEERALLSGVALFGQSVVSSLFFDADGDGKLDLFAGMRGTNQQRLFRHQNDARFEEVTAVAGIQLEPLMFSPAAGDYDKDGDLDLYLSMNRPEGTPGFSQLWRNNGDGSFTDVGMAAGIVEFENFDKEFTPNFVDINNDGWQDLLVVADFETSQVYLNQKDGTFRNITQRDVITDTSGMGSAIGDYDNDGDIDWFVSSIWDPAQDPDAPWGISTGNRLYRNLGDGTFEDATEEAGVRIGYWGWGSTFGDFNNDGWLDIFHTNGTTENSQPFFLTDPVRMFISNGDGTFTERSEALGLTDTGIGNGVAAFDYDRDGDLDLFISNATQGSKLYRNDGGNRANALAVKLKGTGTNTYAVGARLYLTTANGIRQMREVTAGNNFLSQNPYTQHFGLGSATEGDLEVVWPDGTHNMFFKIAASSYLELPYIDADFTDESLSFFTYLTKLRQSLSQYVYRGILTAEQARDYRQSALIAWVRHRNP